MFMTSIEWDDYTNIVFAITKTGDEKTTTPFFVFFEQFKILYRKDNIFSFDEERQIV